MRGNRNLGARQIWGPLTSASTPSQTIRNPACTPFELPSGGAIVFNDTFTSTLTSKLVFQQPCDHVSTSDPGSSGNSTVIGLREPFYASTSPQIFAIATATVISYLLVIIIFITPRTFFVGGPGGASSSSFLGRNANAAVVGVGRRPWLQKIATVTVAISLTIATSDTFRVAEDQYNAGYTDAGRLVDDVVGSLEIRTVRVISDTFLWLAQVQTLIRLFPRHKEKVTIKWLGFALVSLDTIFSILNSFVNYSPRTRPRSFQDAIPALNYLFELAISLIYASCVIYYSISKRRYAFWHSKMRNICLVALLSFVAILIPVVFFVLDVSKPDVAGWGDYIRWVGAAAASVVVWEWVERIEALERDEKQDGILGREIFDDDEMLDNIPSSEEVDFPGRRQYWNRNGFPTEEPHPGETDNRGGRAQALRSRIPFGKNYRNRPAGTDTSNNLNRFETPIEVAGGNHPAMPPQAASPISRSDNTSAGSTIYAVRYHTTDEITPHTPGVLAIVDAEPDRIAGFKEASDPSTSDRIATIDEENAAASSAAIDGSSNPMNPRNTRPIPMWRSVPNPFKRRRASPPAEVAAQIAASDVRRSPIDTRVLLKSRFGAFTSSQRSRFRGRGHNARDETPMVTVIPAQRRHQRTWSSEDMSTAAPVMDQDPMEQRDRPELPRSASYREGLTSDSEMPVLVIPAPRRGQRTWSPEDVNQGEFYHSPYTSPAPGAEQRDDGSGPADRPTDTISPGASGAFISSQGSLNISEDQGRNHIVARRSTYQRTSPLPQTAASQSSRSPPVMAASAFSLNRVLEQEDGPSSVTLERSPSSPICAELRPNTGRESGIAPDEGETDFQQNDDPHRNSAADSES